MHQVARFASVLGVAAVAIAVMPHRAHAQEATKASGFVVDNKMADAGKKLFTSRGCTGCHTIGKGKLAGPDLANVTERRSIEWLKEWLTNPPAMMEKDETAKALLKEFNNTKMPNLMLKDADIDALLNHIARESQKVKK